MSGLFHDNSNVTPHGLETSAGHMQARVRLSRLKVRPQLVSDTSPTSGKVTSVTYL